MCVQLTTPLQGGEYRSTHRPHYGPHLDATMALTFEPGQSLDTLGQIYPICAQPSRRQALLSYGHTCPAPGRICTTPASWYTTTSSQTTLYGTPYHKIPSCLALTWHLTVGTYRTNPLIPREHRLMHHLSICRGGRPGRAMCGRWA